MHAYSNTRSVPPQGDTCVCAMPIRRPCHPHTDPSPVPPHACPAAAEHRVAWTRPALAAAMWPRMCGPAHDAHRMACAEHGRCTAKGGSVCQLTPCRWVAHCTTLQCRAIVATRTTTTHATQAHTISAQPVPSTTTTPSCMHAPSHPRPPQHITRCHMCVCHAHRVPLPSPHRPITCAPMPALVLPNTGWPGPACPGGSHVAPHVWPSP